MNFDRIGNCPFEVLYLPHPLMLPEKVVNDLIEFVRRGGVLISEGCPAYYGDHGRAGENQPNYGLDKVFGAMEERVQFTPVLLEGMKFNMGGRKVAGGVYLQSFIPAGGSIAGTFEDGTAAVIDHHFGSGKTRLIGTCPGYGFYEAEVDPGTREFFGDLLKWAGKGPAREVQRTGTGGQDTPGGGLPGPLGDQLRQGGCHGGPGGVGPVGSTGSGRGCCEPRERDHNGKDNQHHRTCQGCNDHKMEVSINRMLKRAINR